MSPQHTDSVPFHADCTAHPVIRSAAGGMCSSRVRLGVHGLSPICIVVPHISIARFCTASINIRATRFAGYVHVATFRTLPIASASFRGVAAWVITMLAYRLLAPDFTCCIVLPLFAGGDRPHPHALVPIALVFIRRLSSYSSSSSTLVPCLG